MWSIFRSCLIVLVALLSSYGSAGAETIIVVPPYCADMEGNSFATYASTDFRGHRLQTLYPASYFSALPEDQRRCIQMALRPDQTVTGPQSFYVPNVEIRLSTTTKTAAMLSTTFAENIPPEPEGQTTVFSGEMDWHTDGWTAPGPGSFDCIFDLQTPFEYDPSQGNLLVDWSSDRHVGPIPVGDAHDTSAHRMLLAHDRLRTWADTDVPRAIVWQLVFVPEPSTVVCLLALALVHVGRRRSRHSQVSFRGR